MTNPPPEWPLPPDESERVAALYGLGVLDQPQNAELDGLTRLASFICGTRVAVINLVDADRQWQASAHGTDPGEVSRGESMCGRSVLSRDVTYTPDASRDPDFAGSPHVTGELARIRMYAAAPLITSSGHVIGTLCAFDDEPRDLTRLQVERLRDLAASTVRLLELRRTAGDLADAATRDPLTGLPNRALLTESLGRAFARMTRSITDPGVLFVDLDGFKAVNDTHGHAAGDAVLRDVTERLLLCVRASDLVARLGGDEFVILVEESPAVGGAEDRLALLAARVREALDVTVTLHDGARVRLGASVGLAHSTGPDDTPDALLERADAAMYDDKARRRAGR